MGQLTRKELRQKPYMMTAFVVTAMSAALLTMATALSVTDFLQLLFPSEAVPSAKAVNPIESLLNGVYEWLAAQGVRRALLLYALFLLLMYGLKNVCSYLAAVSFADVKTGVLRSIRNRLHRSALERPFSEWSAQQHGQWLSLLSSDMAEYEVNVLESLQLLIQSLLTMVIYVVMLLYLDWKLTLLVVAVMAVGAAILSVSRRLKRQSLQLQSLNGQLMTTTQQTLESIKEIKAATAIDYVNDRQREQNRHFTRRRTGIYRRIYAASPISDFFGNVIVVIILVVGAYRVLGDAASLSPALFVSYIMIYVLLLNPIKELGNALAQLKKGQGIEDRLDEALAYVPPSTVPGCGGEATGSNGTAETVRPTVSSVEMRGVTFAYGDNRVIDNLDLQLPIGHHTAVVGGSGSGKTTLGRLLVGLLQPQQGKILVNGEPTTMAMRAGMIAYIPQEAMLLNDTIESNIRFGRRWITDADIAQAVSIAQLDDLIASLPNGIHTVVGDRGSLLSGGERQRVNIARAVAGNPQVIVMDEATAALDAATEQQFVERLQSSMANRTLVVIAHRAVTIARCHYIFDIEKKELRCLNTAQSS